MIIHRFLASRFREPRTWSLAMCSIAIVMLLVAISQSGSFATDASQVVKPVQVSAEPPGGSTEQVYRAVADTAVENSKSLPEEITSQCCQSESFPQSESYQVTDESQRKFLRYVRLAKLANLTNNERLSARLLAQAQMLLFGYGELE